MIQRRRRKDRTAQSGQDRWLISYADLVTLLFGFFVVMYSVSHVSEQKYKTLSDALGATFSGTRPPTATAAIATNTAPGEAAVPALASTADARHSTWLEQLQAALGEEFKTQGVTVRSDRDWVEVEIQSQVLFASGSAEPSPDAMQLFARIGAILAPLEQAVQVAGHTDSQPINTDRFASNWELSAARAASAARLLAAAGINPVRLSAVGFGEHRPQADNSSAPGRAENRRVVLRLARYGDKSTPEIRQPHAPATPLPEPASTPVAEEESHLKPRRLQHGGLLYSTDKKQKP